MVNKSTQTPEEMAKMSKEHYTFQRFRGLTNAQIGAEVGVKERIFIKIGWSQVVTADIKRAKKKEREKKLRAIENKETKKQIALNELRKKNLAERPGLIAKSRTITDKLRHDLYAEFGPLTNVPEGHPKLKALRDEHNRLEAELTEMGVLYVN